MGATVIPVPSGSMDMGRMDAGATAQYVGENSGPNASEPQFGQLRFDSKKLSCIIPISNDFLRRSPAGAEAMIRKEMLARMGVREDLAFIRGDGAQNTPRGIKSFIAAGNTFTSAVTDATTNLTAANVGSDLGRARRLLKNANTPMLKVGWMISPRTEEAIRNIRDSVGGWLYKQEMDQKGTIDGIPYATSTQIPDNRGSGDESEIYLADFSEFLIGDTMAILMAVSDGAAYKNSSGVVTAAFTEDQTVIKVLSEHDTLLQHSTSAVLVEGCHYGAT
jgi:HK97 family phage major capsid protein